MDVVCIAHREKLEMGTWLEVTDASADPEKSPSPLLPDCGSVFLAKIFDKSMPPFPSEVVYAHRAARLMDAFQERHPGCVLVVECGATLGERGVDEWIAENLGIDLEAIRDDDERWKVRDGLILRSFSRYDDVGCTDADIAFARATGERIVAAMKTEMVTIDPSLREEDGGVGSAYHRFWDRLGEDTLAAWISFLRAPDVAPRSDGIDLVERIRCAPALSRGLK